MKEFLKNNFAEFICWVCKKLDIYIMVNLKLESKQSNLTRLVNTGCVKYCEFSGKTNIY